jgi:hypothetical protein
LRVCLEMDDDKVTGEYTSAAIAKN